jgi:hypothetical protein
MLDLFVASDLVRQETRKAVGTDGSARTRKAAQARRRPLRAGSAAALRGLAELLEPSRHETVTS